MSKQLLTEKEIKSAEAVLAKGDRVELIPVKDGVKVIRVKREEVEQMLEKEIETTEEIPHICPVCKGAGQVKSNIYDVPGVTCSYDSYCNNLNIGSCRACNGRGVIIYKKVTKTPSIRHTEGDANDLQNAITKLEEEINDLERCGNASEFYISNMRNALSSIKEGDTDSAFKFLIMVLLESTTASDKEAVEKI